MADSQSIPAPLEVQMGASRTSISPRRSNQPLEAHTVASRPTTSMALGLHSWHASTEGYDSNNESNGSASPIGSCECGRRSQDNPLGQSLLSPLEEIPPEIPSGNPPGPSREHNTPQLTTAQWPEVQNASAPSTPMSEGSRAQQQEEKKRFEERPRVGEDSRENAMEEYLQFVHKVCELHCQDAANFNSASLRRQLKECWMDSRADISWCLLHTPLHLLSLLHQQTRWRKACIGKVLPHVLKS
jgi:hypothetical protein